MRPLNPKCGRPPGGHCLRGSIGRLVRRRNATASFTSAASVVVGNGGKADGAVLPGSPSNARIKYSMCPDVRFRYSCICCCSSRRRAVRRSARCQKPSLRFVAVNCHFEPCLAIGAGDSRDRSAIVFSIRPRLRFTLPSSSGTDRPPGAAFSASSTR